MKRLFLVVMMMLSFMLVPQPTHAQDALWKNMSERLQTLVPNPQYGDEWIILALARGGYENDAYYAAYIQDVAKTVAEKKGVLHTLKYTEYSRVILALNAIGANPANIGGYNLYEMLRNVDNVEIQGVNGPVFALLALDSKQYTLTSNPQIREQLLTRILANQLPSGSFTLDGEENNIDMTAMTLQALAPYKERLDVQQSIANALRYIEADLRTITSSESYAQIVVALGALQLPFDQAPFHTVIPSLLSFYDAKTGGFKHLKTDATVNGMATEQGAYAYTAYQRALQGQTSLYVMTDDTTVRPFTDTVNHWVNPYAQQAQQQQLMNGYTDGTFRPNQALTRVQAISILVRALQLPAPTKQPVFTDIQRYAQETQVMIQQAYEAGLIQYNGGQFNPAKSITRAQLAIMMARAYTYKTTVSIPESVPTFTDISNYHAETQQAIAFLANNGIVSKAPTFMPAQPTTRAHAAKMFVQFVGVVN